MVIGKSDVVAVLVKIGDPASASPHDLDPFWRRPITLAPIHRVDDVLRQILRKLILPRGHQRVVPPHRFLNQAAIARAKKVDAVAWIGNCAGAPNSGGAASSGSEECDYGDDACHAA